MSIAYVMDKGLLVPMEKYKERKRWKDKSQKKFFYFFLGMIRRVQSKLDRRDKYGK